MTIYDMLNELDKNFENSEDLVISPLSYVTLDCSGKF